MAAENYQKCLNMILHHEGGYVNHPKDPGGETNLGVTKRVYEEWGGTKDMKDLEVEDVAPIYRKNYWDRILHNFWWDGSVPLFHFVFCPCMNTDVFLFLSKIRRFLRENF